MKVFSKEKFIKVEWYRGYKHQWVDECDGKPVKDGYCKGRDGIRYMVVDEWCIDVPDVVNCKCAVATNPRYKITIECDGTTTTARMEINGKEVKTAQAKRNPADAFNWRIGAETAFRRLFGKKEEKKPGVFKVGDRVVCVEATDGNRYTVGKHGRVIRVRPEEDKHRHGVSVEFDKDVCGHSCGGNGKFGYCWNCGKETLRHE